MKKLYLIVWINQDVSMRANLLIFVRLHGYNRRYNAMSNILSIVHNAMWIVFFASLSVNIAAVCLYIRYNRQVGEPDNKVEQSITTAASTVTAAAGTVKQVDTGLSNVSKQLNDSKSTASAISDSTRTSIEGCRDAEETITKLREEIQNLEKCVNSCNDNNSSNNSNTNSNKEINVDEKR